MTEAVTHMTIAQNVRDMSTSKSFDIGIPTVCRAGFLNEDDKRIYNEHPNWLQCLQENVPIWSRLRYFNCLGQQRHMSSPKDTHYDIEIPKRLFSLWGNSVTQTRVAEKMQKLPGYQLVNNVLVCCACLKYNLNQWSPLLLGDIVKNGSKIYQEMMKKLNETSGKFQFKHLNHDMYQLEGTQFRVQLNQLASGFLYIPYGRHQFNLARALMWFFKTHQFGLLHCRDRCLAFGFAVDMEHGFFMYDCQSVGMPLFEAETSNSYVLRTNHLQILLYCLLATLNVTAEKEQFWIYNVDVQMLDATKAIKTRKPLLVGNPKSVEAKRVENIIKARNDKDNKHLGSRGIHKSMVTKDAKYFKKVIGQ